MRLRLQSSTVRYVKHRFTANPPFTRKDQRKALQPLKFNRNVSGHSFIRSHAANGVNQGHHLSPEIGLHQSSTIYALSTPPGRGAIAVIRISGPACVRIYQQLCPHKPLPKPRSAVVRALYGNVGGKVRLLDSSTLVLYFPAPATVTGEAILELHTHGSPAIVQAVLSALSTLTQPQLPVRPADPGEFTRRAFQNDRLSLPDVEALGDTLAAVTEEQRRLSVQATSGRLAATYESWREMLVAARGELEALIDFAEDQHFDESPADLATNVAQQVVDLTQIIETHAANAMRGELLRNGIALSLIGLPNVGKSSILNHIVGRDAAIVSREAGTTRDVIEVGIDLGGYFCRLGDTAGLRSADTVNARDVVRQAIGEVEQEGIRRAKAQAHASDVVILVLSIEPALEAQGVQLELDEDVLATGRTLLEAGKRVIVAINKIDRYELPSDSPELTRRTAALAHDLAATLPGLHASDVFAISAQRARAAAAAPTAPAADSSFAAFEDGLVRAFRELTTPLRRAPRPGPDATDDAARAGMLADGARADAADAGLSATARQRALLAECAAELRRFARLVAAGEEGEVDIVSAAEHLRAAAACLARITGRGDGAGDVEEVLGVVFEK